MASTYNVSREQQDLYAKESQDRAQEAILSGYFKKEIVGIEVDKRHGIVAEDEYPRFDTTVEKLAKLRPVFAASDVSKKTNVNILFFFNLSDFQVGSVTAGNASGINDGAAALVLCSGNFLRNRGLCPLARIVDFSQANVAPIEMGLGPVAAVRDLVNYETMYCFCISLRKQHFQSNT